MNVTHERRERISKLGFYTYPNRNSFAYYTYDDRIYGLEVVEFVGEGDHCRVELPARGSSIGDGCCLPAGNCAYPHCTCEEIAEPNVEDITISDAGSRGYSIDEVGAGHIAYVRTLADADRIIREWMDANAHWPSVWLISDHGNAEPYLLDKENA